MEQPIRQEKNKESIVNYLFTYNTLANEMEEKGVDLNLLKKFELAHEQLLKE